MDRRDTKQREAILDVLRRTGSHPTADWIYDEVRKAIPNISKGTVYRNLNILRDAGEIAEMDFSSATGRTVGRYDGKLDSHYHFSCDNCGRVFDLDEPVDHDLDNRIAQKTGYIVTRHQIEFRGLCKECRKQ